MEEEVRIWQSFRERNYYYYKENNTIYFKSKKMFDIAFLDKDTGILYENTLYKDRFIKAKSEIKKDFKEYVKEYSEYMNMV